MYIYIYMKTEQWTTIKFFLSFFFSLSSSLSLYNLLHPQVFTLYFPFIPICPRQHYVHNCELCMTIGFCIRRMSRRTTGKSACSRNGCTTHTCPHPASSIYILILISAQGYSALHFSAFLNPIFYRDCKRIQRTLYIAPS